MSHRRQFLSACAATTAALLARETRGQAPAGKPSDAASPPVAVFAKPLEHLEFDELGRRLQSLGVQGIEATLRQGGQVAPPQFASDLPRLTEALAKYDQRVLIAASDINQVSKENELQLQQFSAQGIPYIRMSYYRYDLAQPLLPQLETFARQARGLAALCQSLGITALYQNHAGRNFVGAALWDLQQVLQEIEPRQLAVAFDVRHAAAELTQSWPAGYALLRPHVGAVYVKDFAWTDNRPQNVPLGAGVVQPLFEQVQQAGLRGPLSLHMEHIDHRPAALQEQRWAAVVRDVNTLRSWLA
ncbi:MAG: TIM barrel protein [Planctomycetales bacterium]|nr:TIM barrel protein [Planctomycetales bacterium]